MREPSLKTEMSAALIREHCGQRPRSLQLGGVGRHKKFGLKDWYSKRPGNDGAER